MTDLQPVFDGHNDVLYRLWKDGIEDAVANFQSATNADIDVEKSKTGGFVGGFFAMFAPPEGNGLGIPIEPPYDVPLPPMLDQSKALAVVMQQAAILTRLDREGSLRVCTSREDIDDSLRKGTIAAIMHMEGAEAIGPDLAALDVLHAAGLRSVGPVWSRPTIFGHGVPFRYPSDPDIGPGLTEDGKRLVRRCQSLGMIVDTSHLNLAGFKDIAQLGLPLVATHSNAHAVSPGARNLTDDQLRMIGETGGMVGLNFGTMFLRPDGKKDPADCMDAAMRHLTHMVELAGEDHVGIGSDFDGAPMPAELNSAADLPNLVQKMRDHKFGSDLIDKICRRNWLEFISRTLG